MAGHRPAGVMMKGWGAGGGSYEFAFVRQEPFGLSLSKPCAP